MVTLNSIAENIAYKFGEQFNTTLKQSIKDSIINYRATLIRRDLERNPLSYSDYLQSFCIKLKQVDKSECPNLAVNKYVLKSISPIPKAVRLKGNGRTSFKYVGSVDRRVTLSFSSGFEMNFNGFLPFQDNVIYYTINNNYLYVLNNLKLCTLLIEEIIADPRDIQDCNNPNVFPDDIEFPIPVDMLETINELIRKDYPQYIKDGKEINIEKDDRD